MKKLLFIALIALSCAEEKIQKDINDSLVGPWNISGEIEGKFRIVMDGAFPVVETSGWYFFDGRKYNITVKRAVEYNPVNGLITIYLVSGANSCTLKYCDYSFVDFTSINPQNTDCYSDWNGRFDTYSNVQITRP